MKYRTWALAFIALAACGSVGWLIGRGDRPAPMASIPEQTGAELRSPHGINPRTVSDEEARRRVLQLIDLNALGQAPVIEVPRQIDGLEYEAAKPSVKTVSHEVAYEDGLLMMPYAEANAPSPVLSIVHRFDLWMLLFTCGPKLVDALESPEPPMKLRSPRECEECPAHPEVDTLEYRPSDAKKGEYEKFQQRPF